MREFGANEAFSLELKDNEGFRDCQTRNFAGMISGKVREILSDGRTHAFTLYVDEEIDETNSRITHTETIRDEEIIRCRDCRHGIEVVWPACYDIPADWLNCHGYLAPSWDYYNDEPSETPVPPDGFCFWGERREG